MNSRDDDNLARLWAERLPNWLAAGRYDDVIDLARQLAEWLSQRKGENAPEESVGGSRIEEQTAALGLIPCGVHLAWARLEQPAPARRLGLGLAETCRRESQRSGFLGPWTNLAELLLTLSEERKPFDTTRAICESIDTEPSPAWRVLGHWLLSTHPEGVLEDALVEQLSAAPYLSDVVPPELPWHEPYLASFALSFWSRMLESMPFRFGMPRLVERGLLEAGEAPVDQRLRATFEAVLLGVHCRVRPDVLEWLRAGPLPDDPSQGPEP